MGIEEILHGLPDLDEDDAEAIAREPANPKVWTTAIMNGLSLWHDADEAELLAYVTAAMSGAGIASTAP